jgi:hypothetical protein
VKVHLYGNGLSSIVNYHWRPLPKIATPTHLRVLPSHLHHYSLRITSAPPERLLNRPTHHLPPLRPPLQIAFVRQYHETENLLAGGINGGVY